MEGKEMVPAMSPPEWLPEGWSVEFRPRRDCSRFDKYYICPLSGKKLRSKLEVMRFLNNEMPRRCASKSAPSDRNHKPLVQFDHSPSELPDGWIKETRFRKNGRGKDMYFIDPINGYGFRSKKDAFRYLENQDVSSIAYRRKRIHTPDDYSLNEKSLPLIEFRKSEVKQSAVRKCLFAREGSKYDSSADSNVVDPPQKPVLLLLDDAPSQLDGDLESSSDPSSVEHLEQRITNFQTEDEDTGPTNEKQSEPSVLLQGKTLPIPDANISQEKQSESAKKQGQPKRASSETKAVKRKFEIENATPLQAPKRAKAVKIDQGQSNKDDSITDEFQEKLRNLKPFVGQYMSETEELGEKLERLDPFVEQATNEEHADSLTTLPFGGSLLDPCIEFAFKTLTSDFLVLEDIAVLEDHVDDQTGSHRRTRT